MENRFLVRQPRVRTSIAVRYNAYGVESRVNDIADESGPVWMVRILPKAEVVPFGAPPPKANLASPAAADNRVPRVFSDQRIDSGRSTYSVFTVITRGFGDSGGPGRR